MILMVSKVIPDLDLDLDLDSGAAKTLLKGRFNQLRFVNIAEA